MTEEMYQMLRQILVDRVIYWDAKNTDMWSAYESVLTMLEYAHDGNKACLSQFDYYGE